MMQRGLSEGEAMSLAVNGFVNELMKAFRWNTPSN
jgi:Fe-S cluster assembly scaffold protein SufB